MADNHTNFIQAKPTDYGLDILNGELKTTATRYALIGAISHNAPENEWAEFHQDSVSSSYFDEDGVLTFVVNLPIEQDFAEYLHLVRILDDSEQAVIEVATPKVSLAKGIGGLLTIKTTVTGQAGEIVFKSSDYITELEMQSVWLPQFKKEFVLWDLLVGFRFRESIHGFDRSKIALRADGAEISRTDFPKLWEMVKSKAVKQSLINADPTTYAARYGNGNGSSTFTLPNYGLMPWDAVAGVYGSAGTTCHDAIRNIVAGASFGDNRNNTGALVHSTSGALYGSGSNGVWYKDHDDDGHSKKNYQRLNFSASRVVPTANINRPKTNFADVWIIHGEISQ